MDREEPAVSEADGQLAVVTGAASGIGEAVARRLLAAGARVVAVDINERGLAPLVDAGATALVADLADPDDRARVVAAGRGARYLVNAAGILFVRPIFEVGLDEWKRLWAVNIDSMFFLCQGIGPTMPEGGAIVNLSSSSSKLASTVEVAPYTMTKAAVLGVTRSFAYALAPRRVRVNAICPGSWTRRCRMWSSIRSQPCVGCRSRSCRRPGSGRCPSAGQRRPMSAPGSSGSSCPMRRHT